MASLLLSLSSKPFFPVSLSGSFALLLSELPLSFQTGFSPSMHSLEKVDGEETIKPLLDHSHRSNGWIKKFI